ncbi:PGF-CTERM protein [Halogranum gelatinilyticum]|uniref:PGF-CTERM protein n=1 Tax=Halogranum gelatinilyticum TaxID=660521 RepID=A0A1G9UMI2_9EURY|nr:PGF-CTERM sorting domain-containing protein [Halogranum gelatinilyticum]SDM61128.1 PGF-CTERM protein [Halogranum gelatinilyticum]
MTVTAAALEPGDTTTVLVVVANEGDAKGTYEETLSVGDELLETLTATVAAGKTAEFEVTYAAGTAGTYNLTLGETEVVGQLVVSEPPTPEPTPSPTSEATAVPMTEPTATQTTGTPVSSLEAVATTVDDDGPQAGGISGGSAPGFGVIAVIVALLLVSLIALRRTK